MTAALVLSAFGSTSLTLFALLTLLGCLAPWRALWLFFAAYLVVLVVSPETQSLALLGPHPWGAGRFFGMSNELETLLLAPALVLGVLAAPLTLLTFGWSRAGADGGGVLVLLSSYVVLLLGVSPRRLIAAGAVAIVAGLAFVGLDAATGGSSHVTHAVLHGGLPHDIWHRWVVSWHGATGTWGRTARLRALHRRARLGCDASSRGHGSSTRSWSESSSRSWQTTRRRTCFSGARSPVSDCAGLYRLAARAPPRPDRDPAAAARLRRRLLGLEAGRKGRLPLPTTVVGTVPTVQAATVPPRVQERRPGGGQGRLHERRLRRLPHPRGRECAPAPSARTSTRRSRRSRSSSTRVTQGAGAMPSFKGQLTTKQIADVAAYVVKATGGNPNG